MCGPGLRGWLLLRRVAANRTRLGVQVTQKFNARWTTEEQLLAVQGMASLSWRAFGRDW